MSETTMHSVGFSPCITHSGEEPMLGEDTGLVLWYRTYALGDTVLEGLEKAAREDKIALWTDPQPVPPWEWRKRK
jgi:hypothetical protein